MLDRKFKIMIPAEEIDKAVERVALHDPILALNACDRLLFLQDGTTAGSVSPMTDDPAETERLLRMIYGDVRLLRVEEQWVLLRDGK